MPHTTPASKPELSAYYLSYGIGADLLAGDPGPSSEPLTRHHRAVLSPAYDRWADTGWDDRRVDPAGYLDQEFVDEYDNEYDHGRPVHDGRAVASTVERGYVDRGYADDRYEDEEGWYEDEDDGEWYEEDEPAGEAGAVVVRGGAVFDALEGGLAYLEGLPSRWMTAYAPTVIRIGLGLIFVWFGALKLWPGLSPADGLVRATFSELFGLVGLGLPSALALYALAVFEVNIGLGLLLDVHRRAVVWLLIGHMAGTLLPLVLLPELTWASFPHALTLEGQYIVKNMVLVGGAMAIGGAAESNR